MQSCLFHNEQGLIGLNDFVACTAPISSRFLLKTGMVDAAEAFFFVSKMTEIAASLTFSVNSREYTVEASPSHFVGGDWLRCCLDPATLQAGENVLTVPTQPQWAFAVEPRSGRPVIRVRVAGECEPGDICDEAVAPQYGDPEIERTRDEWLALLPIHLRNAVPVTDAERWDWCWELAGFLSTAWVYSNLFDARSYAPWDARTILEWGRAERDDEGNKPIAMCVHYSIAFVQLCIAMGIPARPVVLTPGLALVSGHFVAEVWLEEAGRWAMLDTNMHLAYFEESTGRPLAVAEVAALGEGLRELAHFGPGWQAHSSRFKETVEREYLSGAVYRLWGVWRRSNWIERPYLAPPSHGAFVYCETDIIWCANDQDTKAELAMFPHFLTSTELAAPPQQRVPELTSNKGTRLEY